MKEYEVFLENALGQRVGMLLFERLQLTLRYIEPGRAEIVVPSKAVNFDLFGERYRVSVRREGVVVFSGPVVRVRRNWDPSSDMLSVGVEDDLWWLEKRLVLPVPSGPPYSASHDVRSGVAETVMHQYVYYHAGAGAKVERRIAGLTQAVDQGRGAVVTGRGRFTTLLKLLQKLAVVGGVGFRMPGLRFEVYMPADRRQDVVLSCERNNLVSFSHEVLAAGNYVYVGGGGQGTERVIVEGSSGSMSRWGRVEGWKDQRNTSDLGELNQSIVEYLTEQGDREEQIQFSGIVSLDEVMVGDVISVVFDGVTYQEVVKEMVVTVNGTSERVMIGSVEKPKIYQRLDTVENNIYSLEVI